MAYQLRGDGYHCDRHDVSFGKVGECPACRTDPGPPPVAELVVELPDPPRGCRSSVQLERLLNEDLDELRRLRRKLVGKSRPRKKTATAGAEKKREEVLDLHAYNTIAKLADASTKMVRALVDLAIAREDEELVTARERRLKALRGGRN